MISMHASESAHKSCTGSFTSESFLPKTRQIFSNLLVLLQVTCEDAVIGMHASESAHKSCTGSFTSESFLPILVHA